MPRWSQSSSIAAPAPTYIYVPSNAGVEIAPYPACGVSPPAQSAVTQISAVLESGASANPAPKDRLYYRTEWRPASLPAAAGGRRDIGAVLFVGANDELLAEFRAHNTAATVLAVKEAADFATLIEDLVSRGFTYSDADELIAEMSQARAIVSGQSVVEPVENPPADFPLQSLVLNLTNQCNLSCQYCYEFGEDRVATQRPGHGAFSVELVVGVWMPAPVRSAVSL